MTKNAPFVHIQGILKWPISAARARSIIRFCNKKTKAFPGGPNKFGASHYAAQVYVFVSGD